MAATVSCFNRFNRSGERDFLFFLEEREVVGASVGFLVLLLFDREDVGGALDACEKVCAVVGLEEGVKGFDALDDEREVVLTAERENGVDQVVTLALVFEKDFQAVGEEGEEVEGDFRTYRLDVSQRLFFRNRLEFSCVEQLLQRCSNAFREKLRKI